MRCGATPVRGETDYVAVGAGEIAYQVVGAGALDLLVAPNLVSNVEARWDDPRHARFLERLAGFCRVIALDASGSGLSAGAVSAGAPTVEGWCEDALAVLDAARSSRAVLLCTGAASLVGISLAAWAPERVAGLVIVNGTARFQRATDYPIGISPATVERYGREMAAAWGRRPRLEELAPSDRGDAELEGQHARYERMAGTPRTAARLIRWLADLDVRSALPQVQAPTLVVHRVGNRYLPLSHGRYLAETIPNARLVELPGEDHLYYAGNADEVLDEVQDFLVGTRGPSEPDRRVLTVVFTDLVGSTALASQLGEQRWRQLNQRHLTVVRRELERYRGRVLQEIGDGTLSVFESARSSLRAAIAATNAVRSLGLEVRVGVHTGEVDVEGDGVSGLALHLAARVQALAEPGEVLVTRTVADVLTGVSVAFAPRGEHVLRGIPGMWQLLAVRR